MTSSQTLLRGRTLNFSSEPDGPEDTGAYQYCEDGAVLIEGGLIVASGDYTAVAAQAVQPQVIDHRPHLLMAGFIDTHIHFPQVQVIASWGAQLLDWLNSYTFPEETRFASPEHSAAMAGKFYDLLVGHGTTTAVAYCSVHKTSADAFFTEAARRDMRMIGGKVMMDRNAPDGLMDTPQSGYDDTQALIRDWHGKGRASYAVTPRFAITSTPMQMEMAQALVAENPDCYVQTHLSENHAEIEFTKELYPQHHDYVAVYDHYGLLGPKSLFGHSIHLSDREADAMSASGSVAVFCPTSNLFLGSGLFDLKTLDERDDPVRIAIATDIGGGSSYSMLRTLDEGYKILQLQGQRMTPLESFYRITLGNARALSLEDRIGTIEPSREADMVVLNAGATPAMALRMETVTKLSEELFLLQTMGDDRAIVETYIAGEPAKSVL